jgi:hypothetical protein
MSELVPILLAALLGMCLLAMGLAVFFALYFHRAGQKAADAFAERLMARTLYEYKAISEEKQRASKGNGKGDPFYSKLRDIGFDPGKGSSMADWNKFFRLQDQQFPETFSRAMPQQEPPPVIPPMPEEDEGEEEGS